MMSRAMMGVTTKDSKLIKEVVKDALCRANRTQASVGVEINGINFTVNPGDLDCDIIAVYENLVAEGRGLVEA